MVVHGHSQEYFFSSFLLAVVIDKHQSNLKKKGDKVSPFFTNYN